MTALQWETLFSKVVNTLDNLPIAKGHASSTGHLGSEIITANRIKLDRNNFRLLGVDGIRIDVGTDADKSHVNSRDIYHAWYQFYIDNIHQLLIRPSNWEKTGCLLHINDIVLFMFTDSGYSKKGVVWKFGRVEMSSTRKTMICYVSKNTTTAPPPPILAIIGRNPRDVSVIYATDEFHINTQIKENV